MAFSLHWVILAFSISLGTCGMELTVLLSVSIGVLGGKQQKLILVDLSKKISYPTELTVG